MATTYRLKRKLYGLLPGGLQSPQTTNYDSFNAMRNMNDADLLAEQKKKNPVGAAQIAGAAAVGAAAGGVLNGTRHIFKSNGSILKGGRRGAMFGGLVGVGAALWKRNKQQEQVNEYNDRLERAQLGAKRRERLDFNRTVNYRPNYTY